MSEYEYTVMLHYWTVCSQDWLCILYEPGIYHFHIIIYQTQFTFNPIVLVRVRNFWSITQTILPNFSWFPCEPAWEIILDEPTDKVFPLVCCQPRLITVKPRVSPAFPFLTSTRYDSNDGIGKKEFPWWQLTTRLRFKILRFVFQRTLVWWCFKRYRLHDF